MECNQLILNSFIIICEAYIGQIQFLSSLKSLEFIITECSGDLTGTVRTEVKEYYRILVLNSCNWFAVFLNDCRKNKFICLVIIIRSLDCCSCICALDSLTCCQCFVCQFYTIPAVISVHCIITSGNNTNLTNTNFFHLGFQLFDKFFTGCRRCITSVKETVYINFCKTLSLGHLKQCIEMSVVAVYTAVRKKSHKVDCRIIFFCILHCCKKCFIFEEISIIDFFGDSGKFLIYDASRTHIHMSYLRVTHLSIRQTYCKSTGISFNKWIFLH